MLHLTHVRENEWTRWQGDMPPDQCEPIPTGVYYRLDVRKPDEQTKRRLGLIAARGPGIKFCWLVVGECWVKRFIDGPLNPPKCRSHNVDWATVGIDPARLRECQRALVERVVWCLERGLQFRSVENWPLGAGKTLGGLMLTRFVDHAVVLAPRNVHETWRTEAAKWGFEPPTVTTYESAHKIKGPIDLLILEEAHYAKDSESQRHLNAAAISERASIVVGFTASLVGGRGPLDLRALRAVAKGCVPSSETPWRFMFGLDTKLEEVAPGRKAYVTKTWDTAKVARYVEPWVDTVDPEIIRSELPELTTRILRVPKPRDYDLVAKGAACSTTSSKRIAQVRQCTDGFITHDDGQIVRLSTEKLDAIESFVDHLGEPVVVYAAWSESVKMLAKRLARFSPSVLEGQTADLDLQITRFKQGQTRVLIVQAGFSSGMNLQERCRVMVFMSLSSNPTNFEQAKGRIHRPGQTRGCEVVVVQAEGTIDERAFELVSGHLELSGEQVDAMLEESLNA